MELIGQGIVAALRMLASGDAELVRVTLLTIRVAGTATLLSIVVGIPLGCLLALARFPGRELMISLVNAGMGTPPVVAGLAVSLLLWRSGPFGYLKLMYTPTAMIIAQFIMLAAVIGGFGGVISEVGASTMVGGNILGRTRVLTTATVMEVSKGNFDVAIALSIILMLLIWLVTYALTRLQQRGRPQ